MIDIYLLTVFIVKIFIVNLLAMGIFLKVVQGGNIGDVLITICSIFWGLLANILFFIERKRKKGGK